MKKSAPLHTPRTGCGHIAYCVSHVSANLSVSRDEFEDLPHPRRRASPPPISAPKLAGIREITWAESRRVGRKAKSLHTPRSGFRAYQLPHLPLLANVAVDLDEFDDLAHPIRMRSNLSISVPKLSGRRVISCVGNHPERFRKRRRFIHRDQFLDEGGPLPYRRKLVAIK